MQVIIPYSEFKHLIAQEALLKERIAQLEDELSELKAANREVKRYGKLI